MHLVILHNISSVDPSVYLETTFSYPLFFFCFRGQVGSSTNASLRALKKVAGNQLEVVLLGDLAVIKYSSCDNVGTASPLCLRDVGHLLGRCFVLDF